MKKGILCIVGIIIVCFIAYNFITSPEEISLPENAKIIKYDPGEENYCKLTKYSCEWEEREKVDEDKLNYYYKVTDSDANESVIGFISVHLDKDHLNGSSKDIKFINSEFKKILNHKYNDTKAFSSIIHRESCSESDGVNYGKNLAYSCFNGSNAYISIDNKDGEQTLNKTLDNFFFTCNDKDSENYYELEFDCSDPDMMDIYNKIEENSKINLYLNFNSTDGPILLKIPMKPEILDEDYVTRNNY